jgi:fructokinase
MHRQNSAIICVGEVLWDSLPRGLFLGGAPFNVAFHLNALGAEAVVTTAVGDDALGRIIIQRMEEKGLSADLLQIDQTAPTGLVHVRLDSAGNASYEIVAPAAWDYIRLTPTLEHSAASSGALVFGSLAQRGEVTRKTIRSLLAMGMLKVFDVNLRPPFDDRAIVLEGLERADVVKLNDQEFERLRNWFDLPSGIQPGAKALAERYDIRTVCITRGSSGAALWSNGRFSEHPGYQITVRDTVGSGDAFLAALLKGLLDGTPDEGILRTANAYGAYVATRDGATPGFDVQEVRRIASTAKG